MERKTFKRGIQWLAWVLICASIVVLCQQVIVISRANQKHKLDLAEVNSIKYGLFSVNEWKRQLSEIVSEEISDFKLGRNKKELKKHVETQLAGLIDKVVQTLKDKNRTTFKGRLKQTFINTFVDMEAIKTGIPTYADSIVAQLTQPKTQGKIKGIVQKQVDKYLDKTFDEQNTAALDRVIEKTEADDRETARQTLTVQIKDNEKMIWRLVWALIGLSVLVFAGIGLRAKVVTRPLYFLLIIDLTALLVAGVCTPMIDLVAKISQMQFVLLDHQILFQDQVLYFQSKSILDVFRVMITHKEMQMKAVGILVVMFSIIFPFLKLLSSFLYFFNFRNLRSSRWVQFFFTKSGKWSMTDVLVVAIFMAFIGFNGIISSQLEKLKSMVEEVALLTTNGTALQQGFYLFFTYAALGLFLSVILTKKTPDATPGVVA